MANSLASPGCLSVEPHDDNITNPLLHFHGCIKIGERDQFLQSSLWEKELRYQRDLKSENPEEAVKRMKDSWKSTFDAEMKRTATLRCAISKDNHDKHLIEEVEKRRQEWQQSDKYKEHIKININSEQDHQLLPHDNLENHGSGVDDYKLEKDVSVPVIQFENGKGFTDQCLKGKFPNQKTTIDGILYPEQGNSPLQKLPKINEDRIRYFHIPSNNMIWAEEAISRYYGNDHRPNLTALKRQLGRPPKTNAYTILQERYWRGRLHGDLDSLPHTRYMSHTCETISLSGEKKPVEPDGEIGREGKNIVLFMPYLHWETSRRQEKFAYEIDKIVNGSAKNLMEKEAEAKRQRQGPPNPANVATQNQPPPVTIFGRYLALIRYCVDAIRGDGDDSSANNSQGNEEVPSPEKKGSLGRYLLAAAHLHEAMTTYRDRRLLKEYLPQDPPIHPRRTLDQAYYWTLRSTKKRDKDQVLYRGTTVDRNAFHRYDKKKKKFPEHEDLVGKDCEICRNNIRMVSRVVMVDQLWMWVLDGKTLITCFPKRYGANRQDYSGVHKSIRASLEDIDSNEIRTAFELGLIVLDKCTSTFFSHTKSLDRRPQVIDEFSKAIGNIMHKQTSAFIRLWRWTDKARIIYQSPGHHNTKGLHLPLLDINPEGKLDREIGDIIEELDIMLHILNIHRDIVKRFIEQAERILDPNGDFRKPFEQNPKSRAAEGGKEEKYKDYEAFKLRGNECQDRINRQIKDLESLRQSVKNTAEGVLHLLTMKQQQAGLDQAWQAVKQSDETVKQGRSILVFTLATIIFLPLSFLTSVFGMNNYEFGDNKWKLKDQLLYIFLISSGVVFLSLVFAFSSWIRVWIWSFSARALTKLLVRSGIFTYVDGWKKMGNILSDTNAEVDEMKMEARRQASKNKHERRERRGKGKIDSDKSANLGQEDGVTHASGHQNGPGVENSSNTGDRRRSSVIPLPLLRRRNGGSAPNGNDAENRAERGVMNAPGDGEQASVAPP